MNSNRLGNTDLTISTYNTCGYSEEIRNMLEDPIISGKWDVLAITEMRGKHTSGTRECRDSLFPPQPP